MPGHFAEDAGGVSSEDDCVFLCALLEELEVFWGGADAPVCPGEEGVVEGGLGSSLGEFPVGSDGFSPEFL